MSIRHSSSYRRGGREREKAIVEEGMGPAMRTDPLACCFSPTSPPSKTPPPPPPPPLPLPSSLPPFLPTHSRGLPPAAGTPASSRHRDDCDDADLAGVPPELLPLKKRIVRYHPYAAAWAIQEMASRGGGLRAEAGRLRLRLQQRPEEKDDNEGGLRAELLRLRISRPALVLTKLLTASDRNRDTARLILPERLVRASPLLGTLTAPERRRVFGPRGLPVPAFDRRGRAYRMNLRRDPSAGSFALGGQWTLYLSRHGTRAGDAVELLAFRPSAWQARLDKRGEGGLGMAMLHCPDADRGWTNRERDAADGLLLLISSSCSRMITEGNGLKERSPPFIVSNRLVGVR